MLIAEQSSQRLTFQDYPEQWGTFWPLVGAGFLAALGASLGEGWLREQPGTLATHGLFALGSLIVLLTSGHHWFSRPTTYTFDRERRAIAILERGAESRYQFSAVTALYVQAAPSRAQAARYQAVVTLDPTLADLPPQLAVYACPRRKLAIAARSRPDACQKLALIRRYLQAAADENTCSLG